MARFRLEAQNQEARELIVLFLSGEAAKAMEASEQVAVDSEGVAGYVGRPALGLTAAAVASLAGSVAVAGFVLLTAGLIGLAIGGVGSLVLKKRAIRLKSFADRMRAMVGDLADA